MFLSPLQCPVHVLLTLSNHRSTHHKLAARPAPDPAVSESTCGSDPWSCSIFTLQQTTGLFLFFFPSLIPDEGAETTHFTDCTQTSGSEISQQIGTNSDVFFLYCHAARRRLVCRFYFGSGGSLKQIISHRWVWFSSSLLPSERVVSVTSDCARVSNVS